MGISTRAVSRVIALFALFFSQAAICLSQPPNAAFGAGPYRAELLFSDSLSVPFQFELQGGGKEPFSLYFINGQERYAVRPVRLVGDSLHAFVQQFDNELVLAPSGPAFAGEFRRQDGSGRKYAVRATAGEASRFPTSGVKPQADLSGKWDISFKRGDKETHSVGVFQQEGDRLSGTFLNITGDYRYLVGNVSGKEFSLSTFFGASAFLLKGELGQDGSLKADILGPDGKTSVSGRRNDSAHLPDPYSLTYLKPGYDRLDFSFPDVNGKPVTLKDPKYQGKVVILTITGTWCPNCMDEAAYLAPWFRENQPRGVEAIAIHFERKTDTAYTRKVLTRFKERYDIRYDQVVAGVADKKVVADAFPQLNTFLSFPTILFIDKKGKVAHIYTGYYGPATGNYHEAFLQDFQAKVDALLRQ